MRVLHATKTQLQQDPPSLRTPVLQEWQSLQASFELTEWPPRSPNLNRNMCSEAKETLQQTWPVVPLWTLHHTLGMTLLRLRVRSTPDWSMPGRTRSFDARDVWNRVKDARPWKTVTLRTIIFFPMARQPLGGLGPLIFRGFTITHF
jgi:hypothetical protein